MNEYEVTFTRSAERELNDLPPNIVSHVWAAIEKLTEDPRPSGCRKLAGQKQQWRLRVGDYRVVYGVDDVRQTVDILLIRQRRDAYR